MTLKEIIKSTGWTIKQFSEYFGVPKRTIENWIYRNDPPEYIIELFRYKLEHEGKTKKDGQP
jgi:DNA-binding transcriptional regulator YiaG